MRNLIILFLALISSASAGGAAVDVSSTASRVQDWRSVTKVDLAAARELVEDNHPGALPALHDAAFHSALNRGYRLALKRAEAVTGYGGYLATLQGFAHVFRDEHIWFHSLDQSRPFQWPGFLVSKHGTRWIIVEADEAHRNLEGLQLLSCDGTAAELLGQTRLGQFNADWRVKAQQIAQAPRLFIDDMNPFLKPLKICSIGGKQSPVAIRLSWQPISLKDLAPRYKRAVDFGAAGYGVRLSGNETWISLQALDDRAPAVVQEVRDKMAEIRQSKLVVLDVRGNGGGNSRYGDEIARALLGSNYVNAVVPDALSDTCSEAWRITPGNITTVENEIAHFGPLLGPDYVTRTQKLLTRMRAGQEHGEALARPERCSSSSSNKAKLRPRWPAPFKLILITDGACFSSCLVLTEEYRKLGALQVGRSTDSETRYAEVREEKLPSHLAAFSTLQAVLTNEPSRVGPFAPVKVFPGDIADTQALHEWLDDVDLKSRRLPSSIKTQFR